MDLSPGIKLSVLLLPVDNWFFPFFLKDVTAVCVNILRSYWHNLEGTGSFALRPKGIGSRLTAIVFFPSLSVPLVTMQTAGPEIEDSFDFLFKIILVGDSDVGKTCVVQSFKSGIFIEKQQNTIGVDFTVRTLDIDGKKVKVDDFYFKHLHHSWQCSPVHIFRCVQFMRSVRVHSCLKVKNSFCFISSEKGEGLTSCL